ncbi:acyl-homoserine-lactone synthase [Thiogranum longum]|uniref:acyl-homoserine-lactone synthase n=1 Tax=Thiogranum longum TaxID=1537524 RepID=UPI00104A3C6B|nr:acyl-homoserine-lactone synthase [Thiogranum longum]
MCKILLGGGDTPHFGQSVLLDMFAFRHEVLYRRLGWDVQTRYQLEYDEFDDRDPVYMLAEDDWLLVNARSFDGDETDLIQSLRTAGFFIPGRTTALRQSCGVEWLADGRLQMHCCRQASLREPCASSRFDVPEDDSFVFEYQAPVKRAK